MLILFFNYEIILRVLCGLKKSLNLGIRYLAMRDTNKNYLGILEVSQDITNIRKLEGEKRLLDEIR